MVGEKSSQNRERIVSMLFTLSLSVSIFSSSPQINSYVAIHRTLPTTRYVDQTYKERTPAVLKRKKTRKAFPLLSASLLSSKRREQYTRSPNKSRCWHLVRQWRESSFPFSESAAVFSLSSDISLNSVLEHGGSLQCLLLSSFSLLLFPKEGSNRWEVLDWVKREIRRRRRARKLRKSLLSLDHLPKRRYIGVLKRLSFSRERRSLRERGGS